MRCRRAPAALLAALLAALCPALGACRPATPAATTTPPVEDEDASVGAVVDRAAEVADRLQQREADLESMLP